MDRRAGELQVRFACNAVGRCDHRRRVSARNVEASDFSVYFATAIDRRYNKRNAE